jgi:hypothetical protein
MPVHIFMRLGMWKQAARAGQNSIEVSLALAQSQGDVSWLDRHSEQFHVYVLMQLGQWDTALNNVALVHDNVLGEQVVAECWAEGLDPIGYDVSVFPVRPLCPTCDDPSQTDWKFQLSYQDYTGALCNTGLYAAGFNRSSIVTCPFEGCVLLRPTVVDDNLARRVVAELKNVSTFLSVLRPQFSLVAQMAANMVEGVRLINSGGDYRTCEEGLQKLVLATQQEAQIVPYVPGPQTMFPTYELLAEMLLLVDSLHLQAPGSSNSQTAHKLLSNAAQPHNGSSIILYDMNRTRALFLYAQAATSLNHDSAEELFEHVLSNYQAADTLDIMSPISQPATLLLQRRISFATTMRNRFQALSRNTATRNWFVSFVVVASVAGCLFLITLLLANRLRRVRLKVHPLLNRAR